MSLARLVVTAVRLEGRTKAEMASDFPVRRSMPDRAIGKGGAWNCDWGSTSPAELPTRRAWPTSAASSSSRVGASERASPISIAFGRCCPTAPSPGTSRSSSSRPATPGSPWLRGSAVGVRGSSWVRSADLRAYYAKHTKTDLLDSRMLARLPLLHPEGLHEEQGLGPGDPLRRATRLHQTLTKRRSQCLARLDAMLEIFGPTCLRGSGCSGPICRTSRRFGSWRPATRAHIPSSGSEGSGRSVPSTATRTGGEARRRPPDGLQQQPGEIGSAIRGKSRTLEAGSNGLRQKCFYEGIASPADGTMKMFPEQCFGLGRMGTFGTCVWATSDAR
jgi:hypothetical protein